MPIPPSDAAKIAAQYGLGLSDASALRYLADDLAQAEQFARQFKPSLPEQIAAAEAAGDWDASAALKAAWAERLQNESNGQGWIAPGGYDRAAGRNTPPATDPPSPPEPVTERTPVDQLRSGGPPSTAPPTVDQQIADAETAGDWQTASLLKAELLIAQHRKMQGMQP